MATPEDVANINFDGLSDEDLQEFVNSDSFEENVDTITDVDTITQDQNNSEGDDDGYQLPGRREPDDDTHNPDEEFSNRYKSEGIPDEWLIDKRTGEAYENGLILGKYKTPTEAFRGKLHQAGILDRDGVGPNDDTSEPRGQQPDYADQYLPPKSTLDFQREAEQKRDQIQAEQEMLGQIRNVAMRLVAQNPEVADLFKDEDGTSYDMPTSDDDLKELADANPVLYKVFMRELKTEEDRASAFAMEHQHYMGHQGEYFEQAREDGFDLMVEDMIGRIGEDPDAEDLDYLQGEYDNEVARIMQWAREIPENDPRRFSLLGQYFDLKGGVYILRPESVHQHMRLQRHDLYDRALVESRESVITKRMDREREERRGVMKRAPFLMVGANESGTPNSGTPVMDWDRLTTTGLEELVGAMGESEGEKEWNRQMNYYADLEAEGRFDASKAPSMRARF